MSTFVAAKKVLLSYDALTATDEEGNKYRGTAFEFQDYAYRLANRLNDKDNLHIYMHLTKNHPRSLLERTYEAIADIAEINKGRLFMWKFKEIRKDLQLRKNMKNFDYDHVYKLMKKFRNKYSAQIYKKNESDTESSIANIIIKYNLNNIANKRILLISNKSTTVSNFFLKNNNVFSIEISSTINKIIKTNLGKKVNGKFICKDFFKNSYKDFYFDLVIVNDSWTYLPLESEDRFRKELKRIINPEGQLILGHYLSETENQIWKKFKEEDLYFEKYNDIVKLHELFSNGFKHLDTTTASKMHYSYFSNA